MQRRSKGAAEGRQEVAGTDKTHTHTHRCGVIPSVAPTGAEVSARLETGGEASGEPAGQVGVHQRNPGQNRSVADRQDGER